MAGPTNTLIHHKTPQKRPSAAQVEDALRKSAGNVTAAARGLGVGRTALHARIAKSPDLQRVLQEEREALVDMAESALRAEVLDRNMTAIIWTLKASPEAKRRGWSERHELGGPDGGPVAVTVNRLQDVTDDELRRNLAELSRAAALLAASGGEPARDGTGDASGDDSAG